MSCWPAWGVLEVQHWWPRETYWRCTPKHKKNRRLLWHGDSCRPWSACNFNGWMGDGFCWQIYASPCEQVVGIKGCVLNWQTSKYNGGSSGCSDILKWICTLLHQICRYHVHSSCQRVNQMKSESHLSKSDTDIDSPGGHNICQFPELPKKLPRSFCGHAWWRRRWTASEEGERTFGSSCDKGSVIFGLFQPGVLYHHWQMAATCAMIVLCTYTTLSNA